MRRLVLLMFLSELLVAWSLRSDLMGLCDRFTEKNATETVARTAAHTAGLGFDLVERAY